jgi:hypothetical protein
MKSWNYKGINYQYSDKIYVFKKLCFKFKDNVIWDLIADFGFSGDEARIAYVNNVIDGR